MGAQQVTCFIAVCDDCETEFEHDYTPHWPSSQEAIDDAVNNGDWWSDEGKVLLCDDCAVKPHAFLPSDSNAENCTRCPHPDEEHEWPEVTDG